MTGETKREKCERCRGTGEYIWGAIVNGVPTHRGVCFHCGGKGHQDEADKRRNRNYWRYACVAAFR